MYADRPKALNIFYMNLTLLRENETIPFYQKPKTGQSFQKFDSQKLCIKEIYQWRILRLPFFVMIIHKNHNYVEVISLHVLFIRNCLQETQFSDRQKIEKLQYRENKT